MANYTVRNIPEEVYAVLRQDAERHGHSLNAEVLSLLAERAEMTRRRAGAARAMKELDKLRRRIARMYPNQPDSVELIREDRDSR
jgi:plasmid stability protein